MIAAHGSGTAPPDEATDGGDMTAERDEMKYLVAPEQIPALVAAMGRKLPHHRFTGAGASKLPRPQHFVTTVYFDTPSRHQYRAARQDDQHNLKMRAKEYYDLHPSLAELATDPRQIVRYQPVLWLELKFRDGSRSGKRRIGIPKTQVPAFFAEGAVTSEMIELQRPQYGVDGEAVLREISEYCRRYDEPFRADSLVSYRRLPWQDAEGQLRITLDLGLEFYAPPADLWQRDYALLRETLGAARGREPNGVLEVKARRATPDWVAELLEQAGARRASFSKFEEAARAVHAGAVG
jgi:hypothetical protein